MSEAAVTTQPVPEAGVEPDGIDSVALLVAGVISVVITLAVMFVAAALYFQAQRSEYSGKVLSATYPDAVKALDDQRAVLSSYGPPLAEGQPYKIPIEEAKSLVLAELRNE